MKKLLSVFLTLATLTACAQHPNEIAAADVSPLEYQNLSCKQVGAELSRVQRKVNELYYSLDKTASDDSAQMGIGLVLFWPALFFLDGKNSPQSAEYARLKGEAEALEKVSIRKNCGYKFENIAPPKKQPAPAKKAFKE